MFKTAGVKMKTRLLFTLIAVTIFATSTYALPRFALLTGAKCSSCHVNPTGGQMRNEFGVGFSQEKLPLEALRDTEFTFSGKVSDNISLGGDYRSQFIFDRQSSTTAFQAMTTSIYGAAKLNRKLTLYFKQDLVNNEWGPGTLGGPEVYGLLRFTPSWYIKGGDFLPDYGWKLDDHTAYTRGGDLGYINATGHRGLLFVPNYKDIGVETGGYIGDLYFNAGLFNGTGNSYKIYFEKDKAYSGKLEYMGNLAGLNYRIGASGYGYRSYHMGGVTAGVGAGDLIVFGEMDWTHGAYDGQTLVEGINTMATFGEADFQAIPGIWLTGRFDMFDPLQGAGDDPNGSPDNSVKRVTAGLELFPLSFLEVRPQYRFAIETPSVDNDVALVQMHVWF
jgi:hypothetical protein